ncbi:Stage II sporulation protein R [Caloramator mitchellensis]|uniref:Stage II sporulation protein R n=1 Tax=Caloramator mitchellensis TaxID=908809 RepID=A0A0R3JZR3_CALMK|nr:stage II sporulation protein R [Caloramator mitchellensis]KRQ87773.1 Stage II sporulation protein R [Caloramator mitchellensis]
MKRILMFILAVIIFVMFLGIDTYKNNGFDENLIRFHVIANSDSLEDQTVKLKVRDEVLRQVSPLLTNAKDFNKSYKIIDESIDLIEETANKVLVQNGFNYRARAYLGHYSFPVKKYGDVTLPPGEYTALRVVLGKGEGKNWWCVMFPPLCFIDITRGKVDKKSEEMLKRALEDASIETFNKPNKIQLKFKGAEVFSRAIERIKGSARK